MSRVVSLSRAEEILLASLFFIAAVLVFLPVYLQVRETKHLISSAPLRTDNVLSVLSSPLHQPIASPHLSSPPAQSSTSSSPSKVASSSQKLSLVRKTVHLPILMYHHIGYIPKDASQLYRDLTVSPPVFESQMAYLAKEDYHPISFSALSDYFSSGKKIPERSVIITFDDGWKSQYEHAIPVLKKYHFKATFFIIVNYVGSSAFMSWDQLKELIGQGMEIGSHTLSHPNLKTISEGKMNQEVASSKAILEKKLKTKIIVLAYPYGAYDSRVIKAVKRAGYALARGCQRGVDQSSKNMYSLKAIQVYDNLNQLKKILPPEE